MCVDRRLKERYASSICHPRVSGDLFSSLFCKTFLSLSSPRKRGSPSQTKAGSALNSVIPVPPGPVIPAKAGIYSESDFPSSSLYVIPAQAGIYSSGLMRSSQFLLPNKICPAHCSFLSLSSPRKRGSIRPSSSLVRVRSEAPHLHLYSAIISGMVRACVGVSNTTR